VNATSPKLVGVDMMQDFGGIVGRQKMIIDQETMQAKAWTNSKMHWIPSILAFYE
jgi:hypothetical protein